MKSVRAPLVNFGFIPDDPDAPYDDDDDKWQLKNWKGNVLLLPGLGGNSESWFDVKDPTYALPFILADLGYEVTACDTIPYYKNKADWSQNSF